MGKLNFSSWIRGGRQRAVHREFVVGCCLPGVSVPSISQDDLDGLLLEAWRLGVFPSVYRNLSAAARQMAGPEWAQRHREHVVRVAYFQRREEELSAALRKRGIVCRPVKGCTLAAKLYPEPDWRHIADIDLLVAPGELPAAYEALKQIGLRDVQPEPWTQERLCEAAAQPGYLFGEIRLMDTAGFPVELHWDWLEHSIPEPDREYPLELYWLYLTRHAAKHFWSSLRWCADLELYLRKFAADMDWSAAAERARGHGVERAEAASREVCRQLFAGSAAENVPLPVPREARRQALAGARELNSGPRPAGPAKRLMRMLWLDSPAQRLGRLGAWLQGSPRPGARRRLPFRSAGEVSVFVEAYFWLPMLALALRFVPLVRVQRWACRVSRTPYRGAEPAVAFSRRAGQLVAAAARRQPWPLRCLVRSLTLARLLSRRGIPAELRIGVPREGFHGRAHAWVETGGEAVNDGGEAIAGFAVMEPASAQGKEA